MNKGRIVGAALVAGIVCAQAPALAQDEDGGLKQRLRFDQTFGTGTNLGLEVPAEGRSSLATSRLTYGLESVTRTQRFSFVLGGGLRFGNVATGNSIDTGFTDPEVGLRYSRQAANAFLDIEADLRQSDISQVGALYSFLDQDGTISPPSDFSSVRGSGKRRQYRFDLNLELNQNDPIGFVITAGTNGTRYINPTDPALVDFDRSNVGLSTLFRFNPVTTASLNLSYDRFQSENLLSTDRITKSVEVGLETQVTPRSVLSVRAGQTDVETTEGGVLTTTSGPSGQIGYTTELTNGTFDANFRLTRNAEGQLGTLRFTRTLELPLGSLSANIGLSNSDSSSTQVIGGLNWLYRLDTSQVSLRFNREVLFDANDEQRFTTELVAGYRQEINDVSSFAIDVSLFQSEAGLTSNAVDRGDLKITYERELTADWSLNAGVDLQFRDENTVGRADSTSVFFGLGRSFDF